VTAAFAALAIAIPSAAASVVYVQLRHFGLTTLVMAAGLLPMAVSVLVPLRSGLGHPLAALVLGVVTAQLIAAAVVRRVCIGGAPGDASLGACAEAFRVMGPIIAAALCAMVVLASAQKVRMQYAGVAAMMLTTFAAALGAGAIAGLLPFSEDFITRTNRIRERRDRWVGQAAWIVQSRWAVSVTGIALIFAALAAFGMKPIQFFHDETLHLWIYFFAFIALLFGGVLFVARDWRLAMAATLTLLLMVALALWAIAREGRPLGYGTALWLGQVLLIAALPLAVSAAFVRKAISEGDDPAAAFLRALYEHAPTIVFAGATSSILWIAIAVFHIWWPLVAALSSIFAPLIFPALAMTIHTLLPRYVSIEEALNKR